MINSLDLFHVKRGGKMDWCGTFFKIEAAKAKLKELRIAKPGVYFIIDQTTGQTIFIDISV